MGSTWLGANQGGNPKPAGRGTFGIYTPMQITVTCAQSSALHDLEEDSIVRLASNVDYERTMAAFEEASNLAVDTDETVIRNLAVISLQ